MTPEERAKECADRISNYFSNGGFFNPEMMEHHKVRDLLIDCQRALDAVAAPTTGAHTMNIDAKAVAKKIGYAYSNNPKCEAEIFAALLSVRNEALEEAAKVAESVSDAVANDEGENDYRVFEGCSEAGRRVATAIRALKEGT